MWSTQSSIRRLAMLAVLLLAVISSCAAAPRPRNVIFIIGDGMGIGAITAARCMGPGENGQLVLDTMPVTGLAKTHSDSGLVTDSAASGTALATGHKTLNGRIGMDSQGKTLQSILELADTLGKSTGVITTDAVTGATPAAYYAHVDSRGKEDDIAVQLVASKMIVAMGSGKSHFVPKSGDQDGRGDGQDLVAQAKQKGFDVVFDAGAMAAGTSEKLLGLFSFGDAGPTFESMMTAAISKLAGNPKGFFMMAESCLPDKGGHANNIATSYRGVSDLDRGLRNALEFAKKDGSTLIVVTADHETGGLHVLDRNDEHPRGRPGWISGGHTGNMVAIYAFGPGAERFSGTHDNTELPRMVAELWGKSLGN